MAMMGFCLLLLLLLRPHLFGEVRIKNNNTVKVTFFEDGTGVITDGTSLRVQFNYTFTEGSKDVNYGYNLKLIFGLDILDLCANCVSSRRRKRSRTRSQMES